jgi:hypothetical protein
VDASISGVRLLARTALARGQDISFELEGPLHQKPVQCRGSVIWTQEREDGNVWVGVRLEKYLAHVDVQLLT